MLLKGQRAITFSACLALVITITAWPMSAVSEIRKVSDPLSSDDKQQREWGSVIALYDQAMKKHKGEYYYESASMFKDAAEELKSYIGKYGGNKSSLTHLRLKYRLGNFWEYANEDKKALKCYEFCSQHPLLKSPMTKFDERPIDQQVIDRLSIVTQRVDRVKKEVAISQAQTKAIKSRGGSQMGEDEVRQSVLKLFPLPSRGDDLIP